ncbi:MAG: type II secretion system protein GspC [Gemmatimonadota bacterium]
MQKPAFLAILAASTVVTASSLGVSASRYLSLKYYAPPAPPAARAAAGAAGQRAAAPAPDRWTNVFAPAQGMNIPSKIAKSGEAEPAVETRYVLIGTIASDAKSPRRAIVWAEGMKEPRTLREGEELEPNVRVASIARDVVWLARGRRREKLELLPVGSKARVSMPPASPTPAFRGRPQPGQPAPGAAAGTPSLRVTQLGENLYALDDASVGQLTGNINQYMTQVRIIPYFEGNKSAGYRLAAIRPGSTFEQLGFRGGDIIQQVNNVELSSPEKMYTIFQNLKDEKRVTVDIVRQGQKSTITYEIR